MDAAEATQLRLRQLIDRGFKFIHPRDESGDITAIVGVRPHHDVIDVIQLRTEDDAVATRMPGDTEDVLAPASHDWRSAGSAPRVLEELLALPDIAKDCPPGPGTNGCWIHTGTNRAKWIPVAS